MAAVATLGLALYTASWGWLSVNLIVDALLAAYVALLLQVKQHATMADASFEAEGAQQAEVRVVAG